jgi:dCTP deaminase
MMLGDGVIRAMIAAGHIKIEPFNEQSLGSNSYDVHLAPRMKRYKRQQSAFYNPLPLDCRKDNPTEEIIIPDEGYVLRPGRLYLACTVEYTESLRHVPVINGKSSLGRLGLMVHVTAGFGDVGFCGHWTLELAVIEPLRIYAGMKIAQLAWHAVAGAVTPYSAKPDAKYVNERTSDPAPDASRMHENFKA